MLGVKKLRTILKSCPELEWLKDSVNGTPEGTDCVDKEYKRTFCSIMLLKMVLDDNYKSFTSPQYHENKLSREGFEELRTYVMRVLKSDEDVEAMVKFLIINDLGKCKHFVDGVRELNVSVDTINHDLLMWAGLTLKPELSPTYMSLDKKYQRKIRAGLATEFNFGQFLRCESLPGNLYELLDLSEEDFDFFMVHTIFDIGGALGYEYSVGTKIINEVFWEKMYAAIGILEGFCRGEYIAYGAYSRYLFFTKKYYGLREWSVLKLCNMMSLNNMQEASLLESAFTNLDEITKIILRREMRTYDGDGLTGFLMYYLPSVLLNAYNAFKKEDPYNAIENTVCKILPVIAELYEELRDNLSLISLEESRVIEVNLSDVAKAANDPNVFFSGMFKLELKGERFVFEFSE